MKAIDIMKALNQMGAPKSNVGYMYIIDALLFMDEDNTYINKTIALYEAIGKKHKTRSISVERTIRYEIEAIFSNGDLKAVDDIIGAYRKNNKLPNKEFLVSLYYYIYYNMNTL